MGRVGGKKRNGEDMISEDDPRSPKKLKKSSNVSSTCERLGSIFLSGDERISDLSISYEEVFKREECAPESEGGGCLSSSLISEKCSGEPKHILSETGGMPSVKPKQAQIPARKTCAKPKQDQDSLRRKTSAKPKQDQDSLRRKTSAKPKQYLNQIQLGMNADTNCSSDDDAQLCTESEAAPNEDSSSLPDLTSGTEVDEDGDLSNLDNQSSDSGNSEVQWGNPMGDVRMGMNMQISVGISNSSDFDSTELWSLSDYSNDVQHPSDDGISMGMMRAEEPGEGMALFVDDVVLGGEGGMGIRENVILLEMEGGEVVRVERDGEQFVIVEENETVEGDREGDGAMGMEREGENAVLLDVDEAVKDGDNQSGHVCPRSNFDTGNGSLVCGDIQDGGACLLSSLNCEDDSNVSIGNLTGVHSEELSSSDGSLIQIRPLGGTLDEALSHSDNGQE